MMLSQNGLNMFQDHSGSGLEIDGLGPTVTFIALVFLAKTLVQVDWSIVSNTFNQVDWSIATETLNESISIPHLSSVGTLFSDYAVPLYEHTVNCVKSCFWTSPDPVQVLANNIKLSLDTDGFNTLIATANNENQNNLYGALFNLFKDPNINKGIITKSLIDLDVNSFNFNFFFHSLVEHDPLVFDELKPLICDIQEDCIITILKQITETCQDFIILISHTFIEHYGYEMDSDVVLDNLVQYNLTFFDSLDLSILEKNLNYLILIQDLYEPYRLWNMDDRSDNVWILFRHRRKPLVDIEGSLLWVFENLISRLNFYDIYQGYVDHIPGQREYNKLLNKIISKIKNT